MRTFVAESVSMIRDAQQTLPWTAVPDHFVETVDFAGLSVGGYEHRLI